MSLRLRKRVDGSIVPTHDLPDRHHMSKDLMFQAMVDGWLTFAPAEGTARFHFADGTEAAYRIEGEPGAYCCHCGEKIGDGPCDGNPEEATRRKAYVEQCSVGEGGSSPDPDNPCGYRVDNHYTLIKEA